MQDVPVEEVDMLMLRLFKLIVVCLETLLHIIRNSKSK